MICGCVVVKVVFAIMFFSLTHSLTLRQQAEFDATLTSDKLVVVDFTATWCGPCQMIGPIFAKLAEEMGNVDFVKVDVDANSETAEACEISAMPTFQFYKGGVKVDEMCGADEAGLRARIASNA